MSEAFGESPHKDTSTSAELSQVNEKTDIVPTRMMMDFGEKKSPEPTWLNCEDSPFT